MANSVFDIFKIGIGPSSSHTVGPMVAAALFAHGLEEQGIIADVRGISCELFGSLALTGLGHGTDRAIQLGLMGEKPDTVDPAAIGELIAAVQTRKSIKLLGKYAVAFDEPVDLVFWRGKTLPGASNAIRSRRTASIEPCLPSKSISRSAAVLSSPSKSCWASSWQNEEQPRRTTSPQPPNCWSWRTRPA